MPDRLRFAASIAGRGLLTAVVPQAWGLLRSLDTPVRTQFGTPVALPRPRVVCFLVAVGAILVSTSCGSAVETTTGPGQERCGISANAQNSSFPAAGGSGTIRISANRECTWSAESDAAWLTLSSPLSGQGAASVEYAVAANPDPPSRSARIRIDDQQLVISQEGTPCEYRLSSTGESIDQSGGERTIRVTAGSVQCRWSAVADVPWITIAGEGSGSGSGTVSLAVEATNGPERTGTVTIAGLRLIVTQSPGCRYVVDPSASTVAASGATGIVSVRTGMGCAWTAASTADWLTLAAAVGNGPGDVRFTAAAWSGPGRTGVLRIADQTVTVNQASGCRVSFSPTTLSAGAAGGNSTVQIDSMPGCPWSATTGTSWITITGAGRGTGATQVGLVVAPNSGPAREGSLAISGSSLPVAQASGCTYAVSASIHAVGAAGGTGSVSVSTAGGCRWSAASNAAWIILEAPTGVGSGSMTFTVVANEGGARSGTLTAAGQVITITQASR